MDFSVIDAELVLKLILLLLIGMGPKIALVPFLEKTKQFDPETQRAVGRQMVLIAVITAVVLFATGWLLMRLLHITGGAVAVAGAIILAILAIKMVSGPVKKPEAEEAGVEQDPRQIAVYPLANILPAEPGGYHAARHCLRRGRLDHERCARPWACSVGRGIQLPDLHQYR